VLNIERIKFHESRWSERLCTASHMYVYIHTRTHARNGAVSRVDKQFISRHTWPQHTLSAAETVQVLHALPAVHFWRLLLGCGTSFQDGVAAGEGFLCALFWGDQTCVYSGMRVSRCPTVSMRSELLVAHEKLGQFPLPTVRNCTILLCCSVCVRSCVYRERELL
jgi:hypothetical protein